MKLILDPGHGGTDPGAAAFGYVEKDLNLIVAKRVAELLKEYNPAMTRTSDTTIDLTPRAALIRDKYTCCLSIHFNAGGGQGIETIHSKYSTAGKQLAESIANSIRESIGLPIRRVFSREGADGSDYYALHRNTGSTTTVIVESLFLDSESDLQALNVELISQGIAKGLRSYLEQQKPSEAISPGVYKKVSITGKLGYSTIKRGSKGQDVIVLQEQLRDMGYYTGAIDGDFGPKTDDAVRYLQKVNGLLVDGIVGPATWENILVAYVYEVDPMSLKNEIVKLPGKKIKGDFINSVFFNGDMTSSSNIVQDGKLLNKQWVTNPKTGNLHDNVKRGNLIVYRDGTVTVKMIMDIEKEEDVSKIKFAVSGFNMEPLNLPAEWFKPAEVGYTTWRSALGYRSGKILAVVMPNCSADRMRKVLDGLGCTYKLGLDSGGSTNGRFESKDIRLTNRSLYGIIRFN